MSAAHEIAWIEAHRVYGRDGSNHFVSRIHGMRGLGDAVPCQPGFTRGRDGQCYPCPIQGVSLPCPPGTTRGPADECGNAPCVIVGATTPTLQQTGQAVDHGVLGEYPGVTLAIYGGAIAPFLVGGLVGWKTKSIGVGIGSGVAVAAAEFLALLAIGPIQ